MKHLTVKIHEAPVFVFFQVIVEVLLSDLLWGAIIALSHFEDELPLAENFTFSEGFFLLFLLFQISFMSFIFLTWIRNYYWFEGNMLFHHRGILFSRVDEFLLSELETAHLEQSIFGKIFDYGDIVLTFSNQKTVLRHFPHPYTVLQNIKKLKEKKRGNSSEEDSSILHEYMGE